MRGDLNGVSENSSFPLKIARESEFSTQNLCSAFALHSNSQLMSRFSTQILCFRVAARTRRTPDAARTHWVLVLCGGQKFSSQSPTPGDAPFQAPRRRDHPCAQLWHPMRSDDPRAPGRGKSSSTNHKRGAGWRSGNEKVSRVFPSNFLSKKWPAAGENRTAAPPPIEFLSSPRTVLSRICTKNRTPVPPGGWSVYF